MEETAAAQRRTLVAASLALFVVAGVAGLAVYVDSLGERPYVDFSAGAEVDSSPGAPGELTVTWAKNDGADLLDVSVRGPAEAVRPGGGKNVTLRAVNESVRFRETGAVEDRQTVRVLVIMEGGDERTVLLKRKVTV